MSTLSADIADLIAKTEKLLLSPPASPVTYADLKDLRNNVLPTDYESRSINLYALWVRSSPAETWQCMYIGQRQQKKAWSRVREHLFHTPKGTQSKLVQLAEQLRKGCQVGVTGVLVEPDSIRLALEEELIYRNTLSESALPWNNKGRRKPLAKMQPKERLQNRPAACVARAHDNQSEDRHEATRVGAEPVDQEEMQARVPGGDGTCGAVDRAGADHGVSLPEGWRAEK